MIESNYLLRYLDFAIKSRFKQSVEDYKLFAKNKIDKGGTIFNFDTGSSQVCFPKINRFIKSAKHNLSFEEFLGISESLAFIIIKDDKLVYEKYLDGYNRESTFQVFSITKSFTSALIGIAIKEGFLGNLYDPVTKYLPELKTKGFEKITLNNLLQMHSGIRFKEGFSSWKEMVRSYLYPRGRDLINEMKIEDKIGKFFHYNDYHLILLTAILERVLNTSITKYFEEKIWQRIGAEFPADLCLDNSKNGLEKMESGLVCSPIDLAKFGRLFLKYGRCDGIEVVPESWVASSTDFASTNLSKEYFSYYNNKSWGSWFKTGNGAYKNFWWGYKIDENYYDYFAMGILGQILYISPRNNAIGIRIGNNWGINGWWPTVIKEIIYGL